METMFGRLFIKQIVFYCTWFLLLELGDCYIDQDLHHNRRAGHHSNYEVKKKKKLNTKIFHKNFEKSFKIHDASLPMFLSFSLSESSLCSYFVIYFLAVSNKSVRINLIKTHVVLFLLLLIFKMIPNQKLLRLSVS